jgi:hypothetical protein
VVFQRMHQQLIINKQLSQQIYCFTSNLVFI